MSRIESTRAVVSRRAFLGGLAIGITAASPAFASAPAILRGAGDFRSLNLVSLHTAERLNSVYWVEGEYVPEALQAFNYILRDWREDEIKAIAPKTLDILAGVHGLLGCNEPYHIVSGYRTPETNAMLRRRSKAVAKHSYHIKAMAIDVTLKSRSVDQIASAATTLKAGGVGRYTASDFVHMDSGPVRYWGS